MVYVSTKGACSQNNYLGTSGRRLGLYLPAPAAVALGSAVTAPLGVKYATQLPVEGLNSGCWRGDERKDALFRAPVPEEVKRRQFDTRDAQAFYARFGFGKPKWSKRAMQKQKG